jgi:lipid-A-disaccharide synthase
MRRVLERLLCIFPFEPEFFAEHGMRADYIGHPLTRLVRPSLSKQEFFEKHGLPFDRPLVVLLPGSRLGEVGRHLPVLGKTAAELRARSEVSLILALPHGFQNRAGEAFFKERIGPETIQIVEGETWDALAHADVALAASGTVTIEAALLGTPTVSFYRVTTASWWMGRLLVRVPYYTMVNLVARRRIIPEYLQDEMTPAKLSEATLELLQNPVKADNMRRELNALRGILATERDPMETAAEIVARYIESV